MPGLELWIFSPVDATTSFETFGTSQYDVSMGPLFDHSTSFPKISNLDADLIETSNGSFRGVWRF